uniref:Uncharacterized protein n=1 Tax=Anopheles atroparvus TaxID=41427 RepID=A0A182IR06_ANOAO
MKVQRSVICLVITLMSVMSCICQSSDERTLASELSLSELDRVKPPLDNLNGLLERVGNGDGDRPSAGTSDSDDASAPLDYDTAESNAARLGYDRHNNDAKRSWNKMNAAWGKRGNNGGRNAGWTRFGGAWGKREPGWNNLKGLWGKRADKWDKLSSAWGKRQQLSRAFQ